MGDILNVLIVILSTVTITGVVITVYHDRAIKKQRENERVFLESEGYVYPTQEDIRKHKIYLKKLNAYMADNGLNMFWEFTDHEIEKMLVHKPKIVEQVVEPVVEPEKYKWRPWTISPKTQEDIEQVGQVVKELIKARKTPLEKLEDIKESNFFFDNFTFFTIFSFFIIIIFIIIFFRNKLTITVNNFVRIFLGPFKSLVHYMKLNEFWSIVASGFIYVLFVYISFFILYLPLIICAVIILFLNIFLFFVYFADEFIVNFETIYQKLVLNILNNFMFFSLSVEETTFYYIRLFVNGIPSKNELIHIFIHALIITYRFIIWLSSFLFQVFLFLLFIEIFIL